MIVALLRNFCGRVFCNEVNDFAVAYPCKELQTNQSIVYKNHCNFRLFHWSS